MKYTIEIDVVPGRCHMLMNTFIKALKQSGYTYKLSCNDEIKDFEKIICEEVSKELGVEITPYDLKKDTNKGEIVCARQICMRYKNLNMSLAMSAKPYGRDHATTLHSVKVINNRYNTERPYREMIKRIESRIGKKLVENN